MFCQESELNMNETLEIKGAGILSIVDFVKSTHGPDGYATWLGALSAEARNLAESTIFASSWYGGYSAVFELREKVCDVFYGGDAQSAREIGRFAAMQGLRGIYKALVKLGSVDWVVSRASAVATRYFRPIEITTLVHEKQRLRVRMEGVNTPAETMEASLCGFIARAMEISGGEDVAVHCPVALSKGDPYIEFECSWHD